MPQRRPHHGLASSSQPGIDSSQEAHGDPLKEALKATSHILVPVMWSLSVSSLMTWHSSNADLSWSPNPAPLEELPTSQSPGRRRLSGKHYVDSQEIEYWSAPFSSSTLVRAACKEPAIASIADATLVAWTH
jgi:hypothetical protein